MNFYFIDDDPVIIQILQNIIEQQGNYTVVGATTDPGNAMCELITLQVDIVIIDLLMPTISGIEIVSQLRKSRPHLRFIMLSQVFDRELRAEAYAAGIEFFINKPINLIEVKTVIGNVAKSIETQHTLQKIQNIIAPSSAIVNFTDFPKDKLLLILKYLGIASIAGTNDILTLAELMYREKKSFRQLCLKESLILSSHDKKIMFQRIRRALKSALENVANMYIDGLTDEIALSYASNLFEYKNIRQEMLFIEGKSPYRGKISIAHFFDALTNELSLF